MDGVFEKTFGNLLGNTVINTTGANKCVGEIKQYIHTVKERCCAGVSTLSLKCLLNLIITNIVYYI